MVATLFDLDDDVADASFDLLAGCLSAQQELSEMLLTGRVRSFEQRDNSGVFRFCGHVSAIDLLSRNGEKNVYPLFDRLRANEFGSKKGYSVRAEIVEA